MKIIKRDALFYVAILFSVLLGISNIAFALTVKIIIESISNLSALWHKTVLSIIALLGLVIFLDYIRTFFVSKLIKNNNLYNKNLIFDKSIRNYNSDRDYISILSNDIRGIETEYIHTFFDLIMHISTFVAALLMLFTYSLLHAVLATVLSLVSILITFKLRKISFEKRKAISEEQEKYSKKISDIFKGIFVVQQFQAFEPIKKEHNNSNYILEDRKFNYSIYNAKFKSVSTFLSMTMFVMSFLVGAYLVVKGQYTYAMLMASIELINKIVSPLQQIIVKTNEINGIKSVKNKISALLSETNEETLQEKDSALHLLGNIDIKIDHLDFKFDDSYVLNDINLNFESGKKYVLIGENGSGKTTLLNILSKQLKYSGDSVKINNISINDLSRKDIFDIISYMNQNVFLFNDSILNNITMYRQNIDKIKLTHAIERADISNIRDSIVIENGSNFSGGEKQRIALARVYFNDTDIFLLDEPFSALDPKTKSKILSDLLSTSKTIIMTSHDYGKSFLSSFDEIIFMKKGKIIEKGSFDELYDQKGDFYKLYLMNN